MQKATQMCVSTCQVTSGDAFSITTVPPGPADIAVPGAAALAAVTFAASLSAVGTTFFDPTLPLVPTPPITAVCLYDFLLIAGGRDRNGNQADRYCGNALNPAPIPVTADAGNALNAALPVPDPDLDLTAPVPGGLAASAQVCSKFEPISFALRSPYFFFIYYD
jgi:hypothetical protein